MLGSAFLGAIAWFLRSLDRRLSEVEIGNLIRLERLVAMEAHYKDIFNRLVRIEDKLDKVNNRA